MRCGNSHNGSRSDLTQLCNQWVRPPARQEEDIRIFASKANGSSRRKALEDAMTGSMHTPGMRDKTADNRWFANRNEHVVTAILIADLLDDVRLQFRLVAGRIEGPDQRNRMRVRETIQLFVQVRPQDQTRVPNQPEPLAESAGSRQQVDDGPVCAGRARGLLQGERHAHAASTRIE
jgi:hypothetical protein